MTHKPKTMESEMDEMKDDIQFLRDCVHELWRNGDEGETDEQYFQRRDKAIGILNRAIDEIYNLRKEKKEFITAFKKFIFMES